MNHERDYSGKVTARPHFVEKLKYLKSILFLILLFIQTYPSFDISCSLPTNLPNYLPKATMSFHESAREVRIEEGRFLVAELRNEAGDFVEARFDLNSVLGNEDGRP